MRRRGVRSTLTMQAQTAAFIHFSNAKQPLAESVVTVPQTRRVRPPNLRLEGEEDNRPVLKCIHSESFNADRTSFSKWWRYNGNCNRNVARGDWLYAGGVLPVLPQPQSFEPWLLPLHLEEPGIAALDSYRDAAKKTGLPSEDPWP